MGTSDFPPNVMPKSAGLFRVVASATHPVSVHNEAGDDYKEDEENNVVQDNNLQVIAKVDGHSTQWVHTVLANNDYVAFEDLPPGEFQDEELVK